MTKLESHFASYDQYHCTKGNKLTHYAGIPMIVFSFLGILSTIYFLNFVDLGVLAWAFSTIYYCRLDLKKGLAFSVIVFAMYWLSRYVSLEVHWAVFVIGWILQGIGHYVYEKKSPAFLTNLSHLLIGPFWIFCRLFS